MPAALTLSGVMKCPVCDSRKGKRFCPAKQRLICAQCCGEKRVIEIRCPPDCTFLSSGQNYQRIKNYIAQIQTVESPREREKIMQTSFHYHAFLHALEKGIVEYASDLRTLDDPQIGEALETMKETYRTEDKGIIYEHQSSNPLVQALVAKLREVTEEYRSKAEAGAPAAGPSEVVDCLKVLQLNLRHYAGGSGTGYLNFIRRNHPEATSQGDAGGGLISI